MQDGIFNYSYLYELSPTKCIDLKNPAGLQVNVESVICVCVCVCETTFPRRLPSE